MIQDTDNPDSINSIVLLTDFTREKIAGPFPFTRDGGQFEVELTHETLTEHNVHPEDVENFAYGTALALADGETVGHGEIQAVTNFHDSQKTILAVDDPLYAAPGDPPEDLDVEELRESTTA